MAGPEQPQFTDGQVVEMLRRSYLAVDGLWFVMSEAALGFEQALDLDDRVWRVMPKLQARKAREVLCLAGDGPAELAQAMALKLTAEGHQFAVHHDERAVAIVISACPWRAALERAGRLHIAADIGRRICQQEAEGWVTEFGGEYDFRMAECLCQDGQDCRFVFTLRAGEGRG
jgi:hypothetical protein